MLPDLPYRSIRRTRGIARIAGCLLTLAAVTIGAFGCAQDVGDIDRTQPDKIKKSIFEDDDEWYFRQTVIDTTPESNSGVAVGSDGRFRAQQRPVWTGRSSLVKRIKWEIHKDVLYGRSTISPVEGLTDEQDGSEHQEKGIVAAFPIKSHFDVQRQYNSQTGEPTNVIVEDRSDRPWYEREYMRVDWSQNMVATTGTINFSAGTLSPRQTAKNVRAVPQENGRTNPQRTRISEDYLETVTQYIFDPDLYACQTKFGGDAIWRCEGVTATVRNSFWKVPDKKTYEPLQYRDDMPLTEEGKVEPIESANVIEGGQFVEAKCTDAVIQQNKEQLQQTREEMCDEASFGYFDRFGYIRMNVATWDKQHRTFDSGRKQYAARRNIWETAYDEDGNRIPLEDREPEPIVFHMNAAFPRDMMEAAELVEKEWDVGFTESVRLAKGLESDDAVAEILRENGHEHGQMFVIEKNGCHPGPIRDWLADTGGKREADRKAPRDVVRSYLSGSAAGDLDSDATVDALWALPTAERRRLCSELEWATAGRDGEDARFVWQRYGDMRYSFFAWIEDFNTSGWIGVVVPAIDPKTGEMLNASANVAGRLMSPAATRIADMAQYINGDLPVEDIKDGDHVRRREAEDRGQTQQALVPQNVFSADKAVGGSRIDALSGGKSLGKHPDLVDSVDEEMSKTAKDYGVAPEVIHREAGRTVSASAKADSVPSEMVRWLERPKVKERLMSNPMIQETVETMAVELGGETAAENSDLKHQAYLDLMSPMTREAKLRQQERMFGEHFVMSARDGMKMGEEIAVMMGASEAFDDKSHEELVAFAKKYLMLGVGAHEVGHAVGLEHNFAASMDPMNYQKAYWKLEKLKLDCGDSKAPECEDGELTDREARTGSAQLAKEVLGRDDAKYVNQAELRSASIMDYTPRLAMKPGLGRYDQAALNFAYARHIQRWKPEVELPANFDNARRSTHYTQLPALMGDPDSFAPGLCTGKDKENAVACKKRGIDRIMNGREWVPIDEAIEAYHQRLEHNTKLVSGDASGPPKIERNVPYRYCTDDRRGRYLGCEVFDWGANQVEMLSYTFDRFRLLEPFHRYRGSAIGASSNNMISGYARSLTGTLSKADTPFRYYSFYNSLDYNVGAFTEDLEAAARMGLNFYAELMTRPEPRRYCKYEEGDLNAEHNFKGQARDLDGAFVPSDVYLRAGAMDQCDESVEVEQGPGQYFGYDWSSEYNYRVNRVGTFIDKTLAAGRMFQLDANLAFSQFITDQRAANISYWTEFPDALYEFVHATFMGDYGDFGGGIDPSDSSYHHWKMVGVFDEEEDEAKMPKNLRRIYDPTSFDIRMRTLVNALAMYSSWEDQRIDFDEYLVVAASEKERQNLPEDFPAEDKASFVHPTTHRKFTAIRAADGKSITYDLVEWANELKGEYEAAKTNGDEAQIREAREAMENVVAKLNLIRRARAQFSPEG